MPWETAVDRQARRRSATEDAANTAVEDDRTNVGVIILQQCSLLPTWWACGEEKCSIGLPGRFAFSFASAGEPGPPETAQFGSCVVLPVVKTIFRLVLRHLGPQAPLPTDSPLLNWSAAEDGKRAVYRFRLECSDSSKLLGLTETFASALNKSGYWLASVGFWASVLSQLWNHVLTPNVDGSSPGLIPCIPENALKMSMDFFTFRFLYGAAVLSADIRQRTWTKRWAPATKTERWNAAALLLLKGSWGVTINANAAERAGPMFRGLRSSLSTGEPCKVREAYVAALEYLQLRGFGVMQAGPDQNSSLPLFVKRHYAHLPESCVKQLREAGVPAMFFGVHIAQERVACAAPSMAEPAPEPSAVPEKPKDEEDTSCTPLAKAPCPDLNASHDVAAEQAAKIASLAARKDAAETPSEVLFDGAPHQAVENYQCLRGEVTRLLGARRDPGIYTFFDLGVKGPTRSLKAECKPHACKGCARQIRASVRFVDERPRLRVHARGRHGSLQSPSGGLLWTVAEEHVLASKFTAGVQVTAKAVREVFRQSDLPLRCSNSQLHNWVSRTQRNVSSLPPLPKKGLTAAEMRAAASPFITDVADWRSQPLHRLIILPNLVFEEQRVCAIWTCPGMLKRAEAARNKVVKLAIDGKQKLVANNYTVLTLSFLVSSEHVTQTRDSRLRVSSRPHVHTLTQEPFLQALVNSEAEANVTQFFSTACEIASQCCKLDLKTQVWQVHKDFAKGIEAARRKVFPFARPCDDYPHMRRASYNVLKQKMGVPSARRPELLLR